MKSKSILKTIFIYILILSIFMLSGCGEKKDSQKASAKPQKPTSSNSEPQSEIPPTPEPEPVKNLEVTSPSKSDTTVTSPKATIAGRCDPDYPVYLNEKEISHNADGTFAVEVELKEGANTFKLKHKELEKSYTIRYRYVIISEVSPSSSRSLDGGTTFEVSVKARAGSSVKASFCGTTITLNKSYNAEAAPDDDSFATFKGSFTMPAGELSNRNLGKISFSATYNGKTETASSGSITCKKDAGLANKIYVCEILAYSAETFDGAGTDDTSRPTNNYLPRGTVDYCDYNLISDSNGHSYYKLRCGRRVYIDKNNVPDTSKAIVAKRYEGSLPDHNALELLSLGTSGSHTVIKLKTDWKAPFLLDYKGQSYSNPSKQDYTVSKNTISYIEIKFCYANSLEGSFKIPSDNPLFSRAEISEAGGEKVLRLYLKKVGGFYGWDAEYDSSGNLCFYFLNPVSVSAAENKYGTDLTGVTVFIDVGHGGRDGGASAGGYKESERNLTLANKIKAELEAIGAKVVLSRTTDSSITYDEKAELLRKTKPDYCIAIHHDSSTSSRASGYSTYYSTPFSKDAASFVHSNTVNAGIYGNIREFNWHYYFMARISTCPVVLTENGFISNISGDYIGIKDDATNTRKAEAITKGIVEYFNSIS